MKKVFTSLFAFCLACALNAQERLHVLDLDSSNASNSSLDTYYKTQVSHQEIDMDCYITFKESNLGFLFDIDVRDWYGTIELYAGTKDNIISIGDTAKGANGAVFGFTGATISGDSGGDIPELTITGTNDGSRTPGSLGLIGKNALTVDGAKVTFTDLIVAVRGISAADKTGDAADGRSVPGNAGINIQNGGTVVWNVGDLYDAFSARPYAPAAVNDKNGILFSSSDGTGHVILGKDAAFHNYFFSKTDLSFAEDVVGTVNFTFSADGAITLFDGGTVNIGERTLNFKAQGGGKMSIANGTLFYGAGKDKSFITVEGTELYSYMGGSNFTVTYKGHLTGNFSINCPGGQSNPTENMGIVIAADSDLNQVVLGFARNCDMTVADGVKLTVVQRFSANNWNVVLENGAEVEANGTGGYVAGGGDVNGNNLFNTLTMKENSKFTTNGGVKFSGGEIDGSLIVNGQGSADHGNVGSGDRFIIGIGYVTGLKTTFGANAELKQHNSHPVMDVENGAHNWIASGADVISNAGTGKLDFGNTLYIARGSKITLNTTDAFIVGSDESWHATSQATSLFHLNSTYSGGSGVAEGGDASGVMFEINALNNIGGFVFEEDSKLLLKFGVNGSLILGEDSSVTALQGDFLKDGSIVLYGEIYHKLRVYDFTMDQLKQYFTVFGGGELYIEDLGDGSFWVNTTPVPEPATVAGVLGVLALGFALYRRRK